MVKFLIIRFSSIGDIVLTTPVVRCLKQQVENAEIHFLTKKIFAPILQHNPHITKVHTFDNNFKKLVLQLETEEFHYIIDLHHNLRTFLLKSRLRLVTLSLNKLNLAKWLLVNFKIDRLPDLHIVDRYLQTITLFDVKNDNKGLDFFIRTGDEVDLSVLPAPFQKGYVAMVTGANHVTKQMPDELMAEVCKGLGIPVILLGGTVDREKAGRVVSLAGDNVHNACGHFNIMQSASLIRQSLLVITPDTGLMHIAAAFKKRIISVWGNTTPRFGMYPYQPHTDSVILEVNGLSCRPCSKIGFSKCPKGHFRCMKEIKAADILQHATL